MLPLLSGYKIQTSSLMVVLGDVVQVPRTWRERLLTWPWKPWVSTKPQQTFKPDPRFYVVNGDTIVMHPDMYARLLMEVNKSGTLKDKRQGLQPE